MDQTLPPSATDRRGGRDDRVPGVVVVFTGGAPCARVLPLAGGRLELGRQDGPGKLDDGRASRRHAAIEVVDGRWLATDLASQNGSFADGVQLTAHVATPFDRVLRLGDSLIVPCADVERFARLGVREVEGFVRGPAMQDALAEAERAGRAGLTLHVRGETGAGKEGLAQAFHRASPRGARALVAVNCAAIPHALAERLLFGAKRGPFAGGEADAIGYVQEADGGTLFLDEIGELEPTVQAKLLRVLESREVMALGASKPRAVDFALCSATHRDLRGLVAARTLREDLYFRIATPAVALPPLRDRPEEIPALLARELARLTPARTAHVSLVEQCLLRPWPGNVRELLSELRSAAQAAHGELRVAAHHLATTAGTVFGASLAAPAPSRDAPPGPGPASDEPRKRIARTDPAWRDRIEQALRASAGNVTAAARGLGLHRTQLYRLIEHHGITVDAAANAADDPAD